METFSLRARIFLPVFVLACGASLAYVFSRPAIYVSTARLQFEAAPGQRSGAEGDSSASLLNAAQALTSNEMLDRVGRQLGAANTVGAAVLRGMLDAVPIPGTNVIELRAEGGDRELLPRVLDAWLEAWRQGSAEADSRTSSGTLKEARAAAEQLKQDVGDKRREVEQIRQKAGIVSPERDENQATARLKGLNTALSEARAREVNAESRLNAMRENIAAGRAPAASTDRSIVVELEKRASDVREKMKELEQAYTQRYLAIDPGYKSMRFNLTRLEQQIEQENQASAARALHKAEEEFASAKEAVARLQQELSTRKREVEQFTTEFAEYTAMAKDLARLEDAYASASARLALLEKERKPAGPTLTVLSKPLVPERPGRPDYWRDAALAAAASGALGFMAVWFVEFFRRPDVLQPEPGVRTITHIPYPPGPVRDSRVPAIGGTATRLPESIGPFPRELSDREVRALWTAATPDARIAVAALLGGLSREELAAMRYGNVDRDASYARMPGVSTRACKLRDPLRRLLIERRAARGGDGPLVDTDGLPLSGEDIDGLISCAANDAGLANPEEVTAEALRHTYFAWLLRQGVRLSDMGEFIGRMPPAAFREYGRLSPPGPGLPLEEVDPVFPALRSPPA